MQIEYFEVSEVFIGFALVLASLIIFRYAMRRRAELPVDEKSLAVPLFFMVFGILLVGVASLMNFINALLPLSSKIDQNLIFALTLPGPAALTIAATRILGWKKVEYVVYLLVIFGYVFMGITLLLTFPAELIGIALGVFTVALFIIPAGLFLYLTVTTKRITSLGLAIVLIAVPMFQLTTIQNISLQALVTDYRIFAAAFLTVAFLMPDVKTIWEPLGYSFAYTTVGLVSSIGLSVTLSIFVPIETVLPLIFLTASTVFGYGTGTYAYARWHENRNQATAFLGAYFFLGSMSHTISVITDVDALSAAFTFIQPEFLIPLDYVNVTISVISTMILGISAFIALDWKRSLLFPLLVAIPALLYIYSFFPSGIPTDTIPLFSIVMLVVNTILIITPFILYGVLWWRMQKADIPNRCRPLFLFLGIFAAMTAYAGALPLTSLFPSAMLMIAFLIFWLGITGRADRLLGTCEET